MFRELGFHPRNDLNYQAIVARGGNSFGHFHLFKCPQCGHPALQDLEHDFFYRDLNDISSRPRADEMSCAGCGFQFTEYEIHEMVREPVSYPQWLITLAEVHQHHLTWIVRTDLADDESRYA